MTTESIKIHTNKTEKKEVIEYTEWEREASKA